MRRISLVCLFPLLDVLSCYGFIPFGTKPTFRFDSSSLKVSSNIDEVIPLKKGSTCDLITPMTSAGDVDVASLKKILQFHLDSRTDNLCILGGTGEGSSLAIHERATVLKTAVDMCKGKIPLLVGTGTIYSESVKGRIMQAMDLGCDAALVVAPYIVKNPQQALIQHYTKAVDIGLPVVMQRVPGQTGMSLSDEVIVNCAQNEKIVGLKDDTGDLARLDSLLQLLHGEQKRDELLLFSGDDSTATDFCLKGGDGCISVTANIAPKATRQMIEVALTGATDPGIQWACKDTAQKLNEPLIHLYEQLIRRNNPIPVKWCAKRVGLIESAVCRPPLEEQLDPKHARELESVLRGAGLLEYTILNKPRAVIPAQQKQQTRHDLVATTD